MGLEIGKLIVPLLYLSLFGALGLAIFKGGRAEREGAILYVALWLAAALIPAKEESTSFVYIFLLADAAAAFGFLWLAIRYSNLWLAGAMIAQGISFGAHAFRLEDDLTTPRWHGVIIYLMVMNLASLIVIVMLFLGSIVSWRNRARARKAAEAKAEAEAVPAAA